MPQPRLFFHVEDSLLERQLLKLETLRKFMLVKSSNQSCWTEQLTGSQCDTAVLQVNALSDAQLSAVIEGKMMKSLDFIMLSEGRPDRNLDRLLLQSAGFHYRAPYSFEHIENTLDEFFRQRVTRKERVLAALQSDLEQFGLLVGSASCMRALYQTIRRVAVCDSHVLITGESGSGKEMVANTVHAASQRSDQAFVALNCGALSPELIDSELFGHVKGAFTGAMREHKGVFEQAEGGTLFLDEVTEMPLDQQVKLLRVLESCEYRKVGGTQTLHTNVRVIAATNRNPKKAVAEGVLREDLYFRLAQFPLKVPPLRERGSDIEGLARHFLAYRNAREQTAKAISEAALERIQAHRWAGNVRELKHTIERAFILADNLIDVEHLVFDTLTEDLWQIPSGMPLKELEAAVIQKTLADNHGNRTSSAEQLGISVKTLYNKLEKLQN